MAGAPIAALDRETAQKTKHQSGGPPRGPKTHTHTHTWGKRAPVKSALVYRALRMVPYAWQPIYNALYTMPYTYRNTDSALFIVPYIYNVTQVTSRSVCKKEVLVPYTGHIGQCLYCGTYSAV